MAVKHEHYRLNKQPARDLLNTAQFQPDAVFNTIKRTPMKWLKRLTGGLVVAVALLATIIYVVGIGSFGEIQGIGELSNVAQSPAQVQARQLKQQQGFVSNFKQEAPSKQILFGDMHVHTTYSFDAFTMSLPVSQGDLGFHPPADACDYARYCSALDFWAITDHAEQITPQLWQDTIKGVRQCDAVADPKNPDTVAFLGWEWTQTGNTPAKHFGHKNVVLRGLSDEEITSRPIRAPKQGMPIPPVAARGVLALIAGDQQTHNMLAYLNELDKAPLCETGKSVRDLPDNCMEVANDPNELFEKLDDWGVDSMVIPHGTTWGIYTPPGSDWRKQLTNYHDPKRQTLVEIYSGHGNSEVWLDSGAVEFDDNGKPYCPPSTDQFYPACQHAGNLIFDRCVAEGEDKAECDQRSATAKQNYVEAVRAGHNTVEGADMWTDWLDAGQCRDCFLPTFNYRRKGSAQYMLAMTDFSNPEQPKRFDFGFIASSDNHSGRPGTGYKQFGLKTNTETRSLLKALGALRPKNKEQPAQSTPVQWDKISESLLAEGERFGSFFYTGGLMAVHSEGRDRDSIWQAMQRKEVYATSGPRMLLWFDQLKGEQQFPMGSQLSDDKNPEFRVRALGSFVQKAGCPADAISTLGEQRLQRLCQGECYHPDDQRRRIDRIEIIRVTPQKVPGEAIGELIQDPWKTFDCSQQEDGCEVSFKDDAFESDQRNVVYYARAIEEFSDAINGEQFGCEYDENGQCIAMRDCGNHAGPGEDCLAPVQQRAWSSPIYLDFARQ